MTMQAVPTPAITLPETAPFSPEQRAWLSGFLGAVIASEPAQGVTALSVSEAAALGAGAALASNDDAPWHDPSMPLADRMALAAAKPLAPKLMAAMAQQDCGQCGYNCADYANAIFLKTEERLNLCAPGGKETARKVKELAEEFGREATASAAKAEPKSAMVAPSGPKGMSRENPAQAIFLSREKLNGEGSEKETWHIDFDITPDGLDYVVGDSFGVFAQNDLGLVDQIIAMLGASHSMELTARDGSTKSLRRILTEDVALSPAPDALFELITFVTGGDTRAKARALAQGGDPDGDAATLDVLATLMKFPQARLHAEAFIEALEPLQPRLYSISSSNIATPGKLSLTVDTVRYVIGKRKRLGVASTFLGGRIEPGQRLPVYIQKAHGFALPANPAAPIIMVGPGTGIAPFRAFLKDREATGAPGKNWLFFGHQRQAADFFYKQELHALKEKGVLTRLSLAWSRDGQKTYVQDRMREVGPELWSWLAEGAHFYICGDAKRMAKDVEAALVDIVATHGARSIDEAIVFVQGLKKSGRYQADVY
ncbi:MAG: sulfite reductase subunit alpha [Bosea sp. (in: a-proteobacteria)]